MAMESLRRGCLPVQRPFLPHVKLSSAHFHRPPRLKRRSVLATAHPPPAPQQHASIAVSTSPPTPPSPSPPSSLPWLQILIVFGLTLSTLSSAFTAAILFLRPSLKAAEEAAKSADAAAKDMQVAAKEMEKTALMFQQDLPLTMQDVQRASEEWELVGKQVNFIFSSVSNPLKPVERPMERAAEWVGEVAENTTTSLSKKVASDTSSMANALWATVSQLRQQLGWSGLSKEQAAEAKRLVDIGRQQQEARSWIAQWRGRAWNAAQKVKQKAAQAADAAAEEKRLAGEGVPVEQQRAVKAVLAALDRAQRAAEEAAASSTALELAMYQAEYTGALSSSDEEDWVKAASDGEGGEEDGGGGVQQQKAAQPSRAVGS